MANNAKKCNSKNRKRSRSNIIYDDNEIDPQQSNHNQPLRKKRRISHNHNDSILNDDNFELMLKPKPKRSLKEISNRFNAYNNTTSHQRSNSNNNTNMTTNNDRESQFDDKHHDKKQSKMHTTKQKNNGLDDDISKSEELKDTEGVDACSQDDVIASCKTEEIESDEEEQEVSDNIDIMDDGVWCVLIPSNKEYETIQIKMDEFKIGRQDTNDLVLDGNAGFYESTISNFHGKILKEEKLLTDHSRNGTFVNQKKIKKKSVRLRNGNLLSFGRLNQMSSFFYFDVRGYETKITDFDEPFDVLLTRDKINRNILILEINGNIWHFDERKYNKKYVTNIIYDAVMSKDVASVICSYYGRNVFDAISYHFTKYRPPIPPKPMLKKQNCSFG